MLISIRGTNGSRKSTIVRLLMQEAKVLAIYGVLGYKRPEAYSLVLPSVRLPTYVLGPYLTATGDVDNVQPYNLILDLIKKYAARGHVVFEGVLVSSSYGRVGALMEGWGQEAVMAFLTTSLADCLRNVQKRRDARDDGRPFNPKNATSKYYSIVKSREKILAAGKVRVVDVDPNKGVEIVLGLLRGAK